MNGTARDARKVWFRGFENYVSKRHCVVGPKLAIGVPLSTHPRRQNLERNVSSANVQPTASLKSASAEFFASRNRSSNGLWDNQYHLPWRHTSKCCSATVIPRRHSLAAAVWVLAFDLSTHWIAILGAGIAISLGRHSGDPNPRFPQKF